MNKWQLLVLGVSIAAVCLVLCTAHQYTVTDTGFVIPHDFEFPSQSFNFARDMPLVDWGMALVWMIPIIIISGVLIFILRKLKDPKITFRKIRVILGIFLAVYFLWYILLCPWRGCGSDDKEVSITVRHQWAYILFQPIFYIEKGVRNIAGQKFTFECIRCNTVVWERGDTHE